MGFPIYGRKERSGIEMHLSTGRRDVAVVLAGRRKSAAISVSGKEGKGGRLPLVCVQEEEALRISGTRSILGTRYSVLGTRYFGPADRLRERPARRKTGHP